MAITLTAAYLAELARGVNTPVDVLKVELDSGTVYWGSHQPVGLTVDVRGIIGTVSSLQNKLDQKAGYSTRGRLTFTIIGRDNFKNLIRDEYLKNRRVTRYHGFIAPGFAWADYAPIFSGIITGWSRKGDVLTVTAADDLIEGSKNIPVENATKTQSIDYTGSGAGMNPADIMQDILKTRLGISAALVDDAKFDSEQALWLNGRLYARVLTEPKAANQYLNELQAETNSFIVNDGEKISFKVFAPPVPGTSVQVWNDTKNILLDSLTAISGYKDAFFNRIVVYFDYDESGSDGEANFETAVISADAASQLSSQWDEVKSKVVKSKWIRSFTHNQPTNITGVTVYHVSKANGAGSGTLTFDQAANTLTWTAPGGAAGDTVKLSKDGKFQVFDADKTKWCRVTVDTSALPGTSKSDAITISTLPGQNHATALANKLLSRFRDPSTSVKFQVGLNDVAHNSEFIKPTDLKDLTTDEASEKGDAAWTAERVMLTSVRPDFQNHRVDVEAIETKMYRRYGFIAPNGYPDYPSATAAQREYAFIGNASNKVNGGTEDGYYVW